MPKFTVRFVSGASESRLVYCSAQAGSNCGGVQDRWVDRAPESEPAGSRDYLPTAPDTIELSKNVPSCGAVSCR